MNSNLAFWSDWSKLGKCLTKMSSMQYCTLWVIIYTLWFVIEKKWNIYIHFLYISPRVFCWMSAKYLKLNVIHPVHPYDVRPLTSTPWHTRYYNNPHITMLFDILSVETNAGDRISPSINPFVYHWSLNWKSKRIDKRYSPIDTGILGTNPNGYRAIRLERLKRNRWCCNGFKCVYMSNNFGRIIFPIFAYSAKPWGITPRELYFAEGFIYARAPKFKRLADLFIYLILISSMHSVSDHVRTHNYTNGSAHTYCEHSWQYVPRTLR